MVLVSLYQEVVQLTNAILVLIKQLICLEQVHLPYNLDGKEKFKVYVGFLINEPVSIYYTIRSITMLYLFGALIR